MEKRVASIELQDAWEKVADKWAAEVKSKYYKMIFLPLMEEVENMYRQKEALEREAENYIDQRI